ncbi:MAG: hypothetical protein H6782_00380 [Candidatus Nomurabacteria bacterium]|nr:MAG: hypothetical protein H6782_00380 [Candidatus Nomurabacteria bacterium]
MKIISLNMEKNKHEESVLDLLSKENADIVCLMEVPDYFLSALEEIGYHTTFAPMCLQKSDRLFTQGITFATKEKHEAEIFCYHKPKAGIVVHQSDKVAETVANPIIFADYQNFSVATTHFTWSANAVEFRG